MKKMHIDPLMKRALPAALAASVALALTACGWRGLIDDSRW